MRRYGKFTDGIWIQHRMRMKDARVERELAARQARQVPDPAVLTMVKPATVHGAFIWHMQLATAWARWNGQRATSAQVSRIMDEQSGEVLQLALQQVVTHQPMEAGVA
jgi:hypothetical protein